MTLGQVEQIEVSTHSRPKAAGNRAYRHYHEQRVSTHSRPKAAGKKPIGASSASAAFQHTAARRRLVSSVVDVKSDDLFQHTAARRRLVFQSKKAWIRSSVSTHSRPKAAGFDQFLYSPFCRVSTHSRPKAAGLNYFETDKERTAVSTHSRPKAAGKFNGKTFQNLPCFNTQPPEGGWAEAGGQG